MGDEDDGVDSDGFRTLMDGVKYKEVVEGKGPQAEYKQAVIASWEGVLMDSGVVFEVGRRKMLRVGDGDVPPGLELGLRQLRDGTKCVVRAEPRFAYGDAGRPASEDEGTLLVPGDSRVEWRIEAHRLWYREAEDMSPMDQLVDARAKKTLGNEHFHHENWRKAASNYAEILKGLNVWNFDEGSDDRREAEIIYVDCGNNMVFALMKMDDWLKAEKAVCDVLTVAPQQKKALYRATQIALHLSKWKEAHAALTVALELWPRSKEFRDLYETLREHKQKYKERKAKMSAKMSKQLFQSDDTEPVSETSGDGDLVSSSSQKEEEGEDQGSRRCLVQ